MCCVLRKIRPTLESLEVSLRVSNESLRCLFGERSRVKCSGEGPPRDRERVSFVALARDGDLAGYSPFKIQRALSTVVATLSCACSGAIELRKVWRAPVFWSCTTACRCLGVRDEQIGARGLSRRRVAARRCETIISQSSLSLALALAHFALALFRSLSLEKTWTFSLSRGWMDRRKKKN